MLLSLLKIQSQVYERLKFNWIVQGRLKIMSKIYVINKIKKMIENGRDCLRRSITGQTKKKVKFISSNGIFI